MGALAVVLGCGRLTDAEPEPSENAPAWVAEDDSSSRASTQTPARADRLRDDARLVVEVHCGECHRRDMAEGNPDAGHALEVFDLWDLDWAATLSKSQLAQFEERLTAQGATPAEVARVEAYVRHILSTLGCA